VFRDIKRETYESLSENNDILEANKPLARYAHSTCFDEKTQELYLFGGNQYVKNTLKSTLNLLIFR
jgi:hypothetical protein